MRTSLAQDNARNITRLLEERAGHADLYRTVRAGPSGQRKDLLIARVRAMNYGPYEFEIVNMSPGSPDYGHVAGFARRADLFEMQRHPGAEWSITDYSDYTGYRWLGYASSLALGCDVLLNGVHTATGRHDHGRISPGKWIPNPKNSKE
jgi:hypothetical protein